MKSRVKWILGALLVGAVVMQFITPVRLDSPKLSARDLLVTNAPPKEISTLLHRACYDCHSDETKWPWYGHVAPVSWWLISHVNDGRQRLNFSDWPHDDPERAAKKWSRVSEAVSSGDMPLASYARIHAAARLTKDERDRLVNWADAEAERLRPSDGAIKGGTPPK
jgi:hypothetical protein